MKDAARNDGNPTLLRKQGWLSRQPEGFAEEVLSRGEVIRAGGGSLIHRAGDGTGGIFGMIDGLLGVSAAPSGQAPAIVHYVGRGSWMGILSFFSTPGRHLELRAVSDATLLHLPLDAMNEMAAARPEAARAFGEIAAETIQILLRVVEDLLQPDTGRRVAATLLRVAGSGRERLPITQTDLATMANASRRQVNTILQSFAAQGWIAQGYGSVTVLDAGGLGRALERGELLTRPAYSPPPKVFT